MNKEEAIEILSDLRCDCNLWGSEEEENRYHALSMAIHALGAQCRWYDTCPTAEAGESVENGGLYAEWVERDVDHGEHPIEEWQSAKCTHCGKYHTTPFRYYFTSYPYCPNCGYPIVDPLVRRKK